MGVPTVCYVRGFRGKRSREGLKVVRLNAKTATDDTLYDGHLNKLLETRLSRKGNMVGKGGK